MLERMTQDRDLGSVASGDLPQVANWDVLA